MNLDTLGLLTNAVTVTSGTQDLNIANNMDTEDTAVCDCASLDDNCSQGVCVPATAVCIAQPINEGGVCDDGDPFNDPDFCTAGVCEGGIPPIAPPTSSGALRLHTATPEAESPRASRGPTGYCSLWLDLRRVELGRPTAGVHAVRPAPA